MKHTEAARDIFRKNLHQVLIPYFTGHKRKIADHSFLSPADLYHIILKCNPEIDFFKVQKIRKTSVCRPKEENSNSISNLFFGLHQKFFDNGARQKAAKQEKKGNCRIGVQYSISVFPAFFDKMPRGLAVGSGKNMRWIKPVEARISKYGSQDCTNQVETIGLFHVTLQNGVSGQVGYIDRMDENGAVRSIHLYPDGKMESAERYPEQHRDHKVFRTLMGQILLAEIVPPLYRQATVYLEKMENVRSAHPEDVRPQMVVNNAINIMPLIKSNSFQHAAATSDEEIGSAVSAPSPPYIREATH